MILVCIGLTIGTIAGMFSWLAVAAYLENKRMRMEFSEPSSAQARIPRSLTEASFRPVDYTTGRAHIGTGASR